MIEEKLINDLKPHPINERIYGDTYDHKLISSIEKYGLQGTIEITEDNIIVSGHRRWNVCLELGYETVPITTVKPMDADETIEYVITMNQATRERTNEQIAREFEVLLEIEERKSKESQIKSGGDRKSLDYKKSVQKNFSEPVTKTKNQATNTTIDGNKKSEENIKSVVEKFPQPIVFQKTKSRDTAAIKLNVNWSGRTAAKAHQTVKYVDSIKDTEPDVSEEIKKTLNNQSVSAAQKKVTQHKAVSAKKMNAVNDNIEWSKWSWNPVTGCLHDCPYCYARDIAIRFDGHFKPTFHKDRLTAPEKTTVPKNRISEPGINNVFVCSMADLFGKWVDEKWIDKILKICKEQNQWNYLFLTKNPARYLDFSFSDNCWIGASATNQEQYNNAIKAFQKSKNNNIKFLSFEPLNESIHADSLKAVDWIIIGGRSKNSKMKAFQPVWSWVEHLLEKARATSVPVYFKPNLTVRPKEYPLSGKTNK